MSSNPAFKAGNTAVITGGASGIGLALATKLASYGLKVLIADINSTNLAAAKASIKGDISTFELDVSKLEDYEKLKAKIDTEYDGKISFLALNAAIGPSGTWGDSSYFQKTLDVNLYGVLNGINTLLPSVTNHSSQSSPASIVITGSKQGITNPPGNPAYNASKAAVKSIAEHLSYDLAKSSPSTSVHLLVPGWTYTGLSGNDPTRKNEEKKKPDGAWWPEQVVDYLEKKIEEGKFYVICPDNDVTEAVDRKRMLWSAGDVVEGRKPQSRWRQEYTAEVEEWMKKDRFIMTEFGSFHSTIT